MSNFKKVLVAISLLIVANLSAQSIFKEDFGKSTVRTTSQYIPQAGKDGDINGNFKHGTSFYRFGGKLEKDFSSLTAKHSYGEYGLKIFNQDIWNIDNGYYAVIAPSHIYDLSKKMPDGNEIPWAGSFWKNITNHTDDSSDGAVLVVNGGSIKNQYYRRVVKLMPETVYEISAWVYGSNVTNVGLKFELQDIKTEYVLKNSDNLWLSNSNTWEKKTFTFKSPSNANCMNIAIALRNINSADNGNDFYVDDIELIVAVDPNAKEYQCLDEVIINAMDDKIDLDKTTLTSITANDKIDNEEVILSGKNKNGTIAIIGEWPKGVSLDVVTGLVKFEEGIKFPTGGNIMEYQLCNLIGVCSIASITVKSEVCTKLPNLESPATSYTPNGISTLSTKLPTWPEAIPNGFLALESSSKGLVISRTDDVKKIVDAREGMLVYDTTDHCVKLYNGILWNCIKRSCND